MDYLHGLPDFLGYTNLKVSFSSCPFCNEVSSLYYERHRMIGKSRLLCKKCGAKWTVTFSFGGSFTGAALINLPVSGKGKDLLNKELPPDYWLQMGLSSRKEASSEPKVVRETVKETIIKEIVKVKCPYCRKLYDDSENVCPHCGGSR